MSIYFCLFILLLLNFPDLLPEAAGEQLDGVRHGEVEEGQRHQPAEVALQQPGEVGVAGAVRQRPDQWERWSEVT